jgi:hypothetical protein
MDVVRTAIVCTALVAAGCSGSSAADLPAGWQSARSVQHFSQAECEGSADVSNAPAEAIDATATSSSVSVAYHNAHFRCAQSVQGFARVAAGKVDFLVQPADMNPDKVAQCDCLYELELVEPVGAGPVTVTVYRRWDHFGGNPVEPTNVGSAAITVP